MTIFVSRDSGWGASYASSRGSDDYPPPIQLSANPTNPTSANQSNESSGNASSSRTAGDSLISKQRKHKRKSTLIPRIDNDALQSMAAANINAEEVKATGVELLNKGLLLEIHIPELSDLLTFIRHLDKDFGVYAKIKMPPPPKKERMKKSLPLSHYSSPGEVESAPDVKKKRMKTEKIKTDNVVWSGNLAYQEETGRKNERGRDENVEMDVWRHQNGQNQEYKNTRNGESD
ncbi:uncharacterized protein LOC113465760 [Diaphorina citri]|uniref:Uncharacterized protein LOC113465760 n=1 Tax=Diaphorina citri TaxID=121845 RepID=A0A3Q0IJB7_DIACI|nr:uncharacterized protein LOC113465760 [Diaphorina citri]